MAYRVVKRFSDLQDKGYPYAEGDIYPRKGYEPSAERIEMLSTANNRQKAVLIESIPEDVPEVAIESEQETAEEKPKRKSRKKAE